MVRKNVRSPENKNFDTLNIKVFSLLGVKGSPDFFALLFYFDDIPQIWLCIKVAIMTWVSATK